MDKWTTRNQTEREIDDRGMVDSGQILYTCIGSQIVIDRETEKELDGYASIHTDRKVGKQEERHKNRDDRKIDINIDKNVESQKDRHTETYKQTVTRTDKYMKWIHRDIDRWTDRHTDSYDREQRETLREIQKQK